VDDNFEDFETTVVNKPRRSAGVTMAGAGIGVVLGATLVLKGFLAFLVALIFALVGGAIARYLVAEP
jgi:uncharacterized membrane protein